MKLNLNIGCGKDIRKNYINIDLKKGKGVNLVINLNKNRIIKYFKKGTVDHILCSHLLEHLIDPVIFMQDCYKILKKQGTMEVRLPTTLRTGIFHMRTGHTKGYFYAFEHRGRGYQSYPLFDITVKGNCKFYNLKSYLFQRYHNLKDWFLRQIYDEWIYSLKKK